MENQELQQSRMEKEILIKELYQGIKNVQGLIDSGFKIDIYKKLPDGSMLCMSTLQTISPELIPVRLDDLKPKDFQFSGNL